RRRDRSARSGRRPHRRHPRQGARALPRGLEGRSARGARGESARGHRARRGSRRPLSRDRVTLAARSGLLGLAIGLALADSSVVTLALPDILGRFDVGITTVAWVLTSYNLALAVCAVPAAYVSRHRPRAAFAAGAVIFATASLVCGLAPSFWVLVG